MIDFNEPYMYISMLNLMKYICIHIWRTVGYQLTMLTASLVTKANMSAQETTPGHIFSSADFTASMTWYPLRLRLANASFSA